MPKFRLVTVRNQGNSLVVAQKRISGDEVADSQCRIVLIHVLALPHVPPRSSRKPRRHPRKRGIHPLPGPLGLCPLGAENLLGYSISQRAVG